MYVPVGTQSVLSVTISELRATMCVLSSVWVCDAMCTGVHCIVYRCVMQCVQVCDAMCTGV